MEKILHILQEEFRNSLKATVHSTIRDCHFPRAKNMAKVALGIRRLGKTYFLFQTMKNFLAQQVAIDRILYLNFEDARLFPIDQKKWEKG